jgi:peptidoglycan/xylan/chitin deacetylase (PgdA/CDA1 family)
VHTRRLGIAAAGALALGAGYASGAQTLAASAAPAPATSRLPTGQQAPSSTKTQPQQTPPPTGTQPAGPQPPPPPPQREPKKTAPVRYRIVGCRSSGASPYYHGPSYSRRVAVGFDDGPAALTPAFVTMLERKRVQATFFLIGQQVTATYRPTLLRELRDGDVLGDHSFTHPDLAASGGAYGQLRSTIQAIRAQTGYTPCLFRPPYGAYDQALVSTARSLGLATVLWNVDPTDWALPGTSAIEARVLAQVQPGSIILSHDGGGPRGQTLAAYGSIINKLRARRYRIVTIPELLGFRPVYVPCVRLCEGIGVTRRELPRDAVIQRAP